MSDDERTEKQKALERARKRYEMDYHGIMLNSLVSIFSSATATGITSVLTAVPASQLPIVAIAIFLAQILPKVIIEVHKSYFSNKAKREAYSEGYLAGEDDSKPKTKSSVSSFISMCEHTSYY